MSISNDARIWWNESNANDKIGRGATPDYVIEAWFDAGRPVIEIPVATLHYVKVGKNGNLGNKEYERVVNRSELRNVNSKRGRKSAIDYVRAADDMSVDSTRVLSVQLAGKIERMSVQFDDSIGDYVRPEKQTTDSVPSELIQRDKIRLLEDTLRKLGHDVPTYDREIQASYDSKAKNTDTE